MTDAQMQETIYGLIVHAREMQKFPLEFRAHAQDVVNKLPEVVRNELRAAAREYVASEAERASTALLGASSDVKRAASYAAEKLRRSWLLPLVGVIVAGLVVGGALFGFWLWQSATLHEMQAEIAAVERMKKDYGKADFITCDGKPCVRVSDEDTRRFNKGGVGFYHILHGY